MLLSAVPAVAAVSLLLLAPGLVWAWWCYPAPDAVTRLAIGAALGLAFQMHVVALLAAGPGITTTSVLVATGLALLVAGALAWRTRLPRPRAAKGGRRSNAPFVLGGLLAAIAGVRLAPLAVQQIPMGWDPSFHALLASSTVATGRLPAWAPYERIPINYPYGPHTFIAEITLLSGVAPDRVFAALLAGAFPILTCLALYALTLRLLRRSSYALAAVAAYGLLGDWGSVGYGVWGGLANEIGFFLLLVFCAVLLAPRMTWRVRATGGLILGAIPLAHHHVMLTAALLLGAFALYLLARAWRGDRAARRLLLDLALMALIAAISISFYALPIALRAGRVQETGAITYREDLGGSPLTKNGVALEILAAFGALALYVPVQWWRRWPRLRAPVGRWTRGYFAVMCLTLIGAFVVGHYLYGYISYTWLTRGQATYSLFTPSRFLTDLTYFLAPLAAIALVALWRWLGVAGGRMVIGDPGAPQALGRVAQGALAMAMVAVAAVTVAPQFAPTAGALAPGETEAFAWVRAQTSADTVALNEDPTAHWAPYFTQREVAVTPIPTSEFASGYAAEKQYVSRVLWAMAQRLPSTRVVAAAGTGTALPALAGRPVVALTTRTPAGLVGRLAFASAEQRVYDVPGGYARLQPSVDTGNVLWWSGGAVAPPPNWQTVTALGAGWSSSPEVAARRSEVYLLLTLPASMPAGAVMTCSAQRGAEIWLDGQPVAGGCDGALHPLPATTSTGPRRLAVRARWLPAQQPWAHVFVIADRP